MFPPCLRLPAIILALFGCGCSAIEPRAVKTDESPAQRAVQNLRDAQASTHDDVVAVLTDVQGTDYWCTGIVIEPALVLTAEHCLGPALPPNEQVDCKTATLPAISPQSMAWVVSGDNVKAVAPAEYTSVQNVRLPAAAGRLCGDDIALLELASPLSGVAEAIVTASLPEAGTLFTAVGYGSDGINSGVQRENIDAKLACIGTQCADNRIAASEMLAHSGACEGDSVWWFSDFTAPLRSLWRQLLSQSGAQADSLFTFRQGDVSPKSAERCIFSRTECTSTQRITASIRKRYANFKQPVRDARWANALCHQAVRP